MGLQLSLDEGDVKELVLMFALSALVVTGMLSVAETVAPTSISLPFVNSTGADPLLLALGGLAVVAASLRIGS
jgi:hypothetical protein